MRAGLAALIVLALSAVLIEAAPAQPSEPSAVGLWEQVNGATGKPNAWFLITEHDGVYDATLAKAFVKPGGNSDPVCSKCPGDQKNAPWVGLTVIKGMERDGLSYDNGTILDPRDGSQYFGRMELSPDGKKLLVHGYLGVDPLAGDETWRRLPDSTLNQVPPSLRPGHLGTAQGPAS